MEPQPPEVRNYSLVLEQIKREVVASRHRAALAVNSRMVFLYWQIGRKILEQQTIAGWGSKIITQLSQDLGAAFPEMKGFSPRNLDYMRQFAQEWPAGLLHALHDAVDGSQLSAAFTQQPVAQIEKIIDDSITQQPVAQDESQPQKATGFINNYPFARFEVLSVGKIPWSHHTTLLDKLESAQERWFYCQKIVENGWSRRVLLNQLDRQLHEKQGALTNNFHNTLPKEQSELAKETFKDPYFFDFIGLSEGIKEKELEDKLTQRITDFFWNWEQVLPTWDDSTDWRLVDKTIFWTYCFTIQS